MYTKTLLSASILVALSPSSFADNLHQFDEVVVSATRTEQSKKDVSSSIETISAKELESTMSNDLQQALSYTPGVDALGDGRFGISSFNIRGVEGSRVKMMIDGVQQPTPYNPGATEQRKYSNAIEMDTLQAIEVNKGPSSTLYGSDALGGVVLLRTKNPDDILVTEGDENRFGIRSGYSSANEQFKTTLTWAMRQDKLETLLMATYANGHETETHSSGADIEGPDRGAQNPADSQLGNLLAKAFYQANDDHRLGLTVEYYNKQYDEDELNYNGYSIMPGFTYSDNYNEDTSERLRVGIEHQWLMSSQLADSLHWSLSYQDSRSLSKNYDTTPMNGKRRRQREASDQSIQFDTQLSKIVEIDSNAHEFTYGLSLLNNDFNLDNTDYKLNYGTSAPGSTGLPDATVIQWGLFLQNQAYLMQERLVLTAGIRYDSFEATPSVDEGYTTSYEKNKDDAFTGQLGSVYHLNPNLSIFGQISQGFKAPTVYDLYYFYNQGAIIEANPDLKAEKSLAYELGLRGQNEFANFEFSTFYNDYKDFITQTKGGEQNGKDVFTKENLDEVTIYGAEFSSKLYLDKAFNAPQGMYSRLAVAYADGEDKKTGDALDSVAPLTANVGLGINRYQYGTMLNVKMVASKTDWQSETNTDVAGYTLVDLTAYYQPIQDLTLRAGLFNIFDKKYWLYNDLSGRDATGETFSQDIKAQPGRNWSINIDYQF
ncbi:TonB-dependent hemoglobin/transferrin/lactoferrin family receptor [Vibrio aestuarianus]|uniref:TonB-dependent heme and hemoglobin receptor HutA TonB-dependent hemin, ferrichrome receptor n=1 Tax=Vibrio aestuarianus TaxID=28171 RepID=A0ABM9FPU4_9VIBR|nr:TonB-dependent hemoglobin/transferrin/lactoferrin family receptor [Vibrio aestuarianus]MDE1228513.1 TonB-dependent hemoglobin/transferrin/lactoferrin family receptor [Vibrio aestuarianus]MDE1256519.1 TonB-dependent hemoglobin/transferrin/lactoferrin family receptor [Vibrio aestuarianus]MDE1270580.1 TonB-dependent hemoglobin/transferrin/lactoferrin family receptor [Vibrio aestuarianus]MDE1292576.1 TonB-dependent hemoglobin/transferrin/lactoferrin family receptor [Vibrio aestuarianus]MDE13065